MSRDDPKPGGKPPPVPKAVHDARAAQALRDNLRRRKAAARKTERGDPGDRTDS